MTVKKIDVAIEGEVLPPSKAPAVAKARVVRRAGPAPTPPGAIGVKGWDYEDEFAGKYGVVGAASEAVQLLEPPFLPRQLENICQTNNTLNVCIDALLTNVHGTGFDIVPKDQEDAEAAEIEEIKAFFEETFPGESFQTLRKRSAKDRERVGIWYWEVVRNLEGEMVYLRRLDTKMMRFVRLDDAAPVKVKIRRGGQEFEATVMMRYRRYVQSLNGGAAFRYFKQFGCTRHLNAKSGLWVDSIAGLGPDEIASEILVFGKEEDVSTPYYIPAWMPQLPSVLGSRKAEEHNLDFFDAGGVPPLMIFVNGGELAPEAANVLRQTLNGGARNKHGIPIIETVATGGGIETQGNVRVHVERFGAERQQDSMFEKYDERCEKRVRRAWRLPPLFVGAAEDYSFATAFASYMVAEAQVFAPERHLFDELVNRTIMRELDPEGRFEFRSRPLTVRDIKDQLAGLKMAIEAQVMGKDQFVRILNEILGMGVKRDDDDLVELPTGFGAEDGEEEDAQQNGKPGKKKPTPADKAKEKAKQKARKEEIVLIAKAAAEAFNSGGEDAMFEVLKQVASMTAFEKQTFQEELTRVTLEVGNADPVFARLTAETILSNVSA